MEKTFGLDSAVKFNDEVYHVETFAESKSFKVISQVYKSGKILEVKDQPYDVQITEKSLLNLIQSVHNRQIDELSHLLHLAENVKKELHAEVFNKIGTLFLKKGFYEEAKKSFLAAIDSNTNLTDAYRNLGKVYIDIGDVDRAIAQFTRALYLAPNNADYYLDLGKYWESKISPLWYSFDHKGIHFIVLNSILTYDKWTHKNWADPMDRMLAMARLDNPEGSPFLVGEKQREWLKKDLEKVDKSIPIVVCSHSPLQKIYKGWNFWTDDAESVQALLKPFKKVSVIYGHVHQIQYNQIGNISFQAVMATAWPWPYPKSYVQAPSHLPKLTVPMNRADPFFERDATGWQFIDLRTGNVDMHYQLPDNKNRSVVFNTKTGRPQDVKYQNVGSRIPPQNHY